MINKVTVTCRIKYRNQNGVFNFVGAHYRLISSRGNVIATGKTDSNGMTSLSAIADEGTKVYIEMMNKVTGEWVSPHRSKRQSFKANKNVPRFSIIVTNYYFAVRLLTTNNVPLVHWLYVITFKDATGKKFTERGRTDKAGITKYVSPDTLRSPAYIDIFNTIAKGHTRAAEVKFYPPVTGASPSIYWPVLIPVGSDKAHRTHKLALTTDTTKQITQDSVVQLREAGEHRKIILDIDVTAGASYTIEREDLGSLYDNSMFKSSKITFQDGRKREIGVPKNYYGRLLLKKGNKTIATFPLKGLDPNNKNEPIVFCLSNKSTSVAKQKISVNDIDKTDLMMWHFQTKESLSEGLYEFDKDNKGSNSDLKKIANTIFGSIAFDGVILPTVGEAQNALRNNNRAFIYDAFRKLKVGKDKQDILKFYIKKSKTGANMIIFKGYSGLRSFVTESRYGIKHLKVGMIASSSSVYAAGSSAGIGAAAKTTASMAGKNLGAIGFGIVAVFEIAEWWTSDDPLNNWSDLWIGLGGSAIKAVIATAVGLATAALVVAGGAAIVVIGVGIVVTIVASFALEWMDRRYAITERAKGYINELGY